LFGALKCGSLDCARDDRCGSVDCARDDGVVIPSERSESRDLHPRG
jgi:hypothetical protein